jgi:hypothetical protein
LERTELLRERFDEPNTYLVGQSGGRALGALAAARSSNRPSSPVKYCRSRPHLAIDIDALPSMSATKLSRLFGE